MPILRQNPITKQWVIFAPERAQRPIDFIHPSSQRHQRNEAVKCPFCRGHETETPPEVDSFRKPGTKPNTPGWAIRVVPNKYPALTPKPPSVRVKTQSIETEIPGQGQHEVVIFSANHADTIQSISAQNRFQLLTMLQQRIKKTSAVKFIKYIQVIGNLGREAGASLSHPHLQIFSLPLLPQQFADELKQTKKYYQAHRKCLYCELTRKLPAERIIWEDAEIVCFEPFAPSSPFETWIMPKTHQSRFEETNPKTLQSFSESLKQLLTRASRLLQNPPYNFYFHTLPVQEKKYEKSFHWYLVFKPFIYKIAGFELSTGVFINSLLPEKAAEFLKKVPQ